MRGRLLLEEVLPLPAVGVPAHRERAPREMGDEHLCNVPVIGKEVALRDSLLGPEGLVQIGQAELPTTLPDHGRDRLAFLAHLRSLLVLTEPEVCGRAKPPFVRPFRELDLRDEAWLEPHDVGAADARHPRRLGKRRVLLHERLEDPQQSGDLVVGEAGADVPGPTEPTRLVHGDDERAEPGRAATLALRVADDDHLLPFPHLQLAPVGASPSGLVPGVDALRDDALEPLLPRGGDERVAVLELRRDEDAPGPLVHERFEPLPSLGQW